MIKTEQFEHQRDVYLAHRDKSFYALFWEMGLGKSKLILDVASHLHSQGKINNLVVLAPNEVYQNWLSDEVPAHLAAPHIGMAFPKGNSDHDVMKQLIFLDPQYEPTKLRFMCISYDSIATLRGLEYTQKLLTMYKSMLVADESTAIKSTTAKRSKHAKQLAELADYRWIATGTPVAQSPFDIHSQIEFLSPDFWAVYGLRSTSAFKNTFGVFKLRAFSGRKFRELYSYKKLDKLHDILQPISSRLLKEDSTVKLPPKIYATRRFQLLPEQQMVYNELKTEFQAELDTNIYLEAPLAIVRLTRLQQIASGFVTVEEQVSTETKTIEASEGQLSLNVNVIKTEKKLLDLVPPDKNPRLKLLLELLEECAQNKVIVWCRFRRDVDLICDTLGKKCVRYDGKVSRKDRITALERFKDADDPARVFVGNMHAISRGLTLIIAKTVIYYSNSFSLEKRLQSEDRNHRIGQDQSVLIIDISAEGTVDNRIIESLRNKFDIAALVTGDRLREWIQ